MIFRRLTRRFPYIPSRRVLLLLSLPVLVALSLLLLSSSQQPGVSGISIFHRKVPLRQPHTSATSSSHSLFSTREWSYFDTKVQPSLGIRQRPDLGIHIELIEDMNLAKVPKQRLKPWTDILILGGSVCPGIPFDRDGFPAGLDLLQASSSSGFGGGDSSSSSSEEEEPSLLSRSDLPSDSSEESTAIIQPTNDYHQKNDIQWSSMETRHGLATSHTSFCPELIPCGGVLPAVRFCKLRGLSSLRAQPFHPPKDVHGHSWSDLFYYPTSLPWEGAIVSVTGGAYTNLLGQVFTPTVQYLHGGCQVSIYGRAIFIIFDFSRLILLPSSPSFTLTIGPGG